MQYAVTLFRPVGIRASSTSSVPSRVTCDVGHGQYHDNMHHDGLRLPKADIETSEHIHRFTPARSVDLGWKQ
jgi:hypothetical protein